MRFDHELIYGIYRLEKIESFIDGIQTNERANDGMFVFTRDQKLSVVSGSTDWVMAYTGDFKVNEDCIIINIKSCVVREMEGTTIQRKILKLDGRDLMLDASGSDKTKRTQISWTKIKSL